MLCRGGRLVPGFGLGVGETFAQAATDLQNQVVAVVSAGDIYYAASVKGLDQDFSSAVQEYQGAGYAGANSLGPEINSCGAPSVTTPIVAKALVLYAQLSSLTMSGLPDPKNEIAAYFNQADADKAKSLVGQMVALYNQAITDGAKALKQPSPFPVSSPQPTPSPPPSPSSPSAWPFVAFGVVAAALVTVVFYKPKIRRSSHGTV